jgi:hypothetical protein
VTEDEIEGLVVCDVREELLVLGIHGHERELLHRGILDDVLHPREERGITAKERRKEKVRDMYI